MVTDASSLHLATVGRLESATRRGLSDRVVKPLQWSTATNRPHPHAGRAGGPFGGERDFGSRVHAACRSVGMSVALFTWRRFLADHQLPDLAAALLVSAGLRLRHFHPSALQRDSEFFAC